MSRLPILLTLWILTDAILFVGGFVLAYFLRVGWILSSDFPFDPFLKSVLVTAPLWVAVLATSKGYAIMRNQRSVQITLRIIYSTVIAVALFTLIYYFWFTAFFSRLLLVYAFLLTTVIILVWHNLYQVILRTILRTGSPQFPTLIVGATREVEELINTLNANKSPLTPVAILDGQGSKKSEIQGVPVLGKLNKLEETLNSHSITHLIQASDLEQNLNLLSACRNRSITYILLPSVLGMVQRDEHTEMLEGWPVTIVRPKKS